MKIIRYKCQILFATMLLTGLTGICVASPEVVVKGLFSNAAFLQINGQDQMVRAGETTADGVTLVSSNSREAVVRMDGVNTTLTLSGQIASGFTETEVKEVRITKSADSHFRVSGEINGFPVEMLVDTGATAVAMNARDAKLFGIDYLKGDSGHATTAAGPVPSYMVDLANVSVGNIIVHNIKGVVIEGDFPNQVLLGNTFLKHVSMEQDADLLILKSKF